MLYAVTCYNGLLCKEVLVYLYDQYEIDIFKIFNQTEIQCGAIMPWSISTQIPPKTPYSSPGRVAYGVSIVNITPDAYFISVIVVPYVKTMLCRTIL